jgi:GNAT superfamily N-acetyltransferase
MYENKIRNFHTHILQGVFEASRDELEPFENWLMHLDDDDIYFDILLAVEGDSIIGGITCEYFPTSKTGLVGYLATQQNYRNKGVARMLVKHALNAFERSYACHIVFIETRKGNASQLFLQKLGFAYLDLNYTQPRLCPHMKECPNMMLGVCSKRQVKTNDVVMFLKEYFIVTMGQEGVYHPELQRMILELQDLGIE